MKVTIAPVLDVDATLSAWAIEHAPDHLRYAAERGFVIKTAVLDTIAQMVATAVGGSPLLRAGDDLIKWQERRNPQPEILVGRDAVLRELTEWKRRLAPPDIVKFSMTAVVRVEQQTDVRDPDSILKYSGVVITITCADLQKRYVLVNLEARR